MCGKIKRFRWESSFILSHKNFPWRILEISAQISIKIVHKTYTILYVF